MRLAVLSDIHGNAWALDAVLAEFARAEVHGVINLGDCFYGPLDPGGTLERLRAYEDDFPLRHVMESGTPHARWAILTRVAAGYEIEFHATPYDTRPAVRSALANGREAWARWLRSGRARLAG
jgi:hypothetical protein